jgi:tRNA G18 (ribose-2'-O)-methylase SpoU
MGGMSDQPIRGWFAIGAEAISKEVNFGNLMRTAHAFGAAYLFLVDPATTLRQAGRTDTSRAHLSLPVFRHRSPEELTLPHGAKLVGVELTDDAVPLPSFRHPSAAAYVFGPERASLSPAMLARCDHVVRIPTRFCVNLAIAAAIVMYDRQLTLGRFGDRPVMPGGPVQAPAPHVHGGVVLRRARTAGASGG